MNIHMMTPLGYTGYGYAGKNILLALNALGHTVGLTMIGQPHIESETEAGLIRRSIDSADTLPYDTPCLKIWHQFDLLNRVGSGKYCALPFFESDKLTQKEKHHLNFADHIIVSSSWAKEVLAQNEITKPVTVVPLGVNRDIFNDTNNHTNKTPNYVFIIIGKWETRKGHDIAIQCFNKAFTSKDNVELWLVTHNPFLSETEEKQWINLVEQSPLRNKIRMFPRLNTHQELASLISYAHCGVYVSRAEGWNMELLETMSMNKPVIATNYSAHTEYCNRENTYLVDIEKTEPAIDNKWFFGTSNWANLGPQQCDQIIGYMRHLYENRIDSNSAGVVTAQALSWENTASSIARCISSIS